MNKVCCTIITSSHISYARTLFNSIRCFDSNVIFVALVIDNLSNNFKEKFNIISIDNILNVKFKREIVSKYQSQPDSLRWSLKSILMIHLLEVEKFDQVFYLDSDIFFFGDFRFLYEELAGSSFLLSPHWGCIHPNKSELYFSSFMTNGLYNAGFIGATSKGLNTLYWWAEVCLYACEIDKSRGLFVDQSYLNVFPILNPDTKIIKHKGCNVADWNRFEVERSLNSDGNLILDNFYPLIFVHFTNIGYLLEFDPLLFPYLKKYEYELRKNGFQGELISTAFNFISRKRLNRLSMFERFLRRIIGRNRFAKLKGWDKIN